MPDAPRLLPTLRIIPTILFVVAAMPAAAIGADTHTQTNNDPRQPPPGMPSEEELRSGKDPAGQPIRPGAASDLDDLATTPPTRGADERYAREPLPRRAPADVNGNLNMEIRLIRREHFGDMRKAAIREAGFERLRQFKSPSAITAMYEELRNERDDVVLVMLDHVRSLGDAGQAALTWMAIMDANPNLRHEATRRIERPVTSAALGVLDTALRSPDDQIANRAGSLAGAIGATQAIPLLIAAQATERERENTGDLAWIAIQTQRSYVQNLVPVTGDNAGAFQPIIGVIGEGVVFRVMDAVVVTYRTEIHHALVALSSADWGQPTDRFGYDIAAWRQWYRDDYLPVLAERSAERERVARAKQLERQARDEDE
jgi:hypothetical protein